MGTPVTITEIQQLINIVNTVPGGYTTAYDYLSARDYNYADWANGVAQGNSIAGISALEFLQGTAMMGMGGPECQSLSSDTIESIRQGMANDYLETLLNQATRNGGVATNDIDGQDVWQIHKDVFERNGLSIENWTLNAPFQITQKLYGDQGVENLWTGLRETGGTGGNRGTDHV